MHFKDFTDQFYQYPHHLSYSHLLRNPHESFVSLNKTLIEDMEKTKEMQMRSRKRRFNGKMLKNIFTQLKNKTSSELEEFIDLNSLKTPPDTPNKTKVETYNFNVSNDVDLSKSTGVEKREWRKAGNNPEIQMSVDSQEFEHMEKSIRFVVCPKRRLGSVPADYIERKIELNVDEITSSTSKIKNGSELHEGRVVDVYNVLKKVISNVKWKYKKCRSPNNPPQSSNDSPAEQTTTSNIENTKHQSIKKPLNCTMGNTCDCCKCNNNGKPNWQKQEANRSSWSKEDETLICLLKLETRENFKQIKQIEQELKLQKKALRFLNNRCKSLENVVRLNANGPERKMNRNNSDTDVQEIFVKATKQYHKNNNHGKIVDNSLEKENNSLKKESHTPSFEEGGPKNELITLNASEDTEEDSKIENDLLEVPKENHEGSVVSDIKEIQDVDRKTHVNPEDRALVLKKQSLPPSQSILGSKIKITISRSTVVINTTNDELTNTKNNTDNQFELSTVQQEDYSPEDSEDCRCPVKKSSFVFKLFRKQSCDSKCKCCTISKTNRKRCRYFIERKNKGCGIKPCGCNNC